VIRKIIENAEITKSFGIAAINWSQIIPGNWIIKIIISMK
jgi:hypothetical protein